MCPEKSNEAGEGSKEQILCEAAEETGVIPVWRKRLSEDTLLVSSTT